MPATTHTTITLIDAGVASQADDVLAVEEPLEIQLGYTADGQQHTKVISVTMRTPGHDAELAAGFLFTEGIIKATDEVAGTSVTGLNRLLVSLASGNVPHLQNLERNFYTTSSCGVCGKASIDAVNTVCDLPETYPYDMLSCPASLIVSLPAILRRQQSVFEQTGGLHGCALFSNTGELLLLREDVGRHNALDKLIGAAWAANMLPLGEHILLLSGRASFELVQKAAMAGINMIAAVGAPSSLAVQMAEDRNMTLIGFLRGDRFNIYSGAQRVVI